MDLVFRDISVDIKGTPILQDVGAMVKHGAMLAILGPSGAGKTTLLNALAGRQPLQTGEILVNGKQITKKDRRSMCYVLQQEAFFGNLTLRQTLRFQAMLRLPEKMPLKDKLQRVDDLVDELDLRKCYDTVMGNMFIRGLSGGERKRANILSDLLTSPKLMLLDEPTSGLDASTALNMMLTLKSFTHKKNKTVVTSIHQPSSQIFHMFDDILLLCNGQVGYSGSPHKLMDFFSSIGLHCELHYNPADFMLEKAKESEENQAKMIEAAKMLSRSHATFVQPETKPSQDSHIGDNLELENNKDGIINPAYEDEDVTTTTVPMPSGEKDYDIGEEWHPSWFTQYKVLTVRNLVVSKRRILSIISIIRTAAIAVLASLLWFQLDHNEDTTRDRMGVLFFTMLLWSFTPLIEVIQSTPEERGVVLREQAAGFYPVSAYYMARMTSELPVVILLPCCFLIPVYWIVGLNGPLGFFGSMLTISLVTLSSQSVGFLLGSLNLLFPIANALAVTLVLGNSLCAGFYTRHIPDWASWISYLSFLYYGFHGMMVLEFTDANPITCNPPGQSLFPECNLINGTTSVASERILEVLQIEIPYWASCLALLAYIVLLRTIAYLILRYRKP